MNRFLMLRCCVVVAALLVLTAQPASVAARGGGGRGGGGGGRGGFSGGGARPSMGGGGRPSMASRPSGGMSRPSPSISRPSMANASRPSPSRPSPPSRPGSGSSHPSLGGISRPGGGGASRPSTGLDRPTNGITRPSLPGGSTRPAVRPGGDLRPTRPSFPGAGDIATRPSLPGRPEIGGGDRPSFPSHPDRPTIGGGTRPGQGGGGVQRPDVPNRPDRPIAGGGGDRPGIGNGDRPVIGGGDNNLHIGDNVNINRPGWGIDNRPGDDRWSQNHWHDHWNDHCIHSHYHGWYNGCWHGNWGGYWWRPTSAFFVGWGLGSWGYSDSYYNPYYVESAAVPYDYSQPVVVNNYVSSDADAAGGTATAPPVESPENEQAMKLFDEGMAAFKAGQYPQALTRFDGALKLLPGDPVLHEVRALTLFALGKYQEAAAVLDSLLASAPGMDWTTVTNIYGNIDDYTTQLRALEQHVKAKPNDAAAAFVLAYHYLITGHNDEAVEALQRVVKLQPKDATAQRMLKALAPAAPAAGAPATTPPPAAAGADAPETDLVGRWRAMAGDSGVELTITEDSQFTWKATPKGQPSVELSGQIAATRDTLVLESATQGSMVGQVKSAGPDKFSFVMAGSAPGDEGLVFERQK